MPSQPSPFGAAIMYTIAAAVIACPLAYARTPPKQPGSSSLAADVSDVQFVKETAMTGLGEVQLGKLAAGKATNDRTKAFGRRMAADHGKANDELKSLAMTKQIVLPTDLDAKHKTTVDRLKKLDAAQFDGAYIEEMVRRHQKALMAFIQEAELGRDADVKGWATKTLPTIQDHLRTIQEIKAETKRALKPAAN